MRLIDADALLEAVKNFYHEDYFVHVTAVKNLITNAPTIEADSGEAVDKKDTAIATSLAKFMELKNNLYITELNDVINLCKAALSEPEAVPNRTGYTYYKNNSCKAESANSHDCICWTKDESVTLPDGWVAVPVEPTIEMKTKGAESLDIKPSEATKVYKAMLQAAPTLNEKG